MSVTPVFQGEVNECGLACLAMVLNYHGRHLALRDLRGRHPGGEPLNLDELSEIAHAEGLATRALRCEPGDLRLLALPAILHVDFDHYVVVEKAGHRHAVIIDPASGRTSVSLAALGDRFTGIALELWPAATFAPLGRPRRYSFVAFLRRLHLNNLGKTLSGLLLLSLGIQFFTLISPFFLQVMVDEVLLVGSTDLAFVVTAGFGAIYLISALTRWLRGLLEIQAGTRLSQMMSAHLLETLLMLPGSYFERRTIGDIVSRFGSLRPLQDFISHTAIRVILDALMILTTLLMITAYSPAIAAWVLCTTGACIGLQYLLLQPYRQHQHAFLIAEAGVQTHFIETVQTLDTARRHGAVPRRFSDWMNRLVTSLNSQVSAGRWSLAAELVQFVYAGITTLGVVYLAVGPIDTGLMTIGMLYALTTYSGHFSAAVQSILLGWQDYLLLSLHVQRLADITDEQPDSRAILMRTPAPAQIELENVSFSHPGSSRLLIASLTLRACGDDKVAITGPSGCGKSTLLALLAGELAASTGQVLINRRPLSRTLNPAPWFSTLLPTDRLIEGTVGENISYLAERIDPVRMQQAAATACIDEDILSLPLAYQEPVSEQGRRLSAGQRQRLLIARAVYRQAPILLLDEATSQLDAVTEYRVMHNLLALPGICFFVTHRPELAELADQVLELNPHSTSHELFIAAR